MMLRIEAGLPLIDVEWHNSRLAFTDHDRVTPKELGMGWMLRGVRDGDRALRRQRGDPPRAGRRHVALGHGRHRRRLGGLGPAAPRRRPAARRRTSTRCRYESVLHDATDGRRHAGRLRHQLLLLPGAAAPHRPRPGAARPRRARHRACTWRSRCNHAQHDGARAHREAAPLQPREEDGQAMSQPRAARPHRHAYDAIVVGGGHNGLVNAGYLAKAGLRTLVLEQRAPRRRRGDHRGAACPGFSFTTFSYALSLLRPGDHPRARPGRARVPAADDAVVVPPDRRRRLPAARRRPRRRTSRRSAGTRGTTPTPTTATTTTSTGSCQAVRPLFDNAAARTSSARTPRTRPTSAWLLDHLGGVERKVMHDVVRLLTGSAVGLARGLLRARGRQGLPRVVAASSAPRSARCRPAPGWCCCSTRWASTTGTSARGRSTRAATAASPRCSPGRPRRTAPRSGSAPGSTPCSPRSGRAVGVALEDGTELRAPVVVSALDPRRTFLDLRRPARAARRPGRQRRADEVPRRLRQGQLRPRRAAGVPRRCPDTVDHYGGFLNIGPTIEYVERAFDAAKYGWYSERPFIDAAIQSVVDPDMAPPGKHVMSCFVQYAPYELRGQRLGDRARALRRQGPGRAGVALPRLRRPGAAPRGRHAGRHRARHRAHRGQHLRRASSSPRRCTSSARRPGWSQYRTPIDGYYQCGSGTHPGGCVIGSPGKLASQRILRDLRSECDDGRAVSKMADHAAGLRLPLGRARRVHGGEPDDPDALDQLRAGLQHGAGLLRRLRRGHRRPGDHRSCWPTCRSRSSPRS